jgi:hypothetical protein
MPYELSFTKRLTISNREQYINECCAGGDFVLNALLPSVRERYTDLQSGQEDWGWFAWFRKGEIRLAIDIFTDDPDDGVFRVHLTSRIRRLLWSDKVIDTPELEELRDLVSSLLAAWTGGPIQQTALDAGD